VPPEKPLMRRSHKAWNRLGPDRALAGLEVLAASEVTDEGVLVLEIAPREEGVA
jgi:hypothetical protein